jgi:hypothetical protein
MIEEQNNQLVMFNALEAEVFLDLRLMKDLSNERGDENRD